MLKPQITRRAPVRPLCDPRANNPIRKAVKQTGPQQVARVKGRVATIGGEEHPPSFAVQAQAFGATVGIYETPNLPHIYYFNPSVIDWQGKRWVAFRRSFFDYGHWRNYKSTVSIFESLGGNKLGPEILLDYPKRDPMEQTDDPRLSIINGVLHLSVCVWRTPDKPAPGKPVAPVVVHQTVAELDEWKVAKFIDIDYQGNTGSIFAGRAMEKNWLWFDLNGERWCLYHAQPQTVLCESDGAFVEEHRIEQDLGWRYGQIRGGAPPVRVGDEFVTFFHSSVPWKVIRPAGMRNRYFMGAMVFKAEPPFTVTRITREPILTGTYAEPYIFLSPPVVFPAGAVLKDGRWTISYGINDCVGGWIELDHETLEKRLIAT